jgi:hypothetical protein
LESARLKLRNAEGEKGELPSAYTYENCMPAGIPSKRFFVSDFKCDEYRKCVGYPKLHLQGWSLLHSLQVLAVVWLAVRPPECC